MKKQFHYFILFFSVFFIIPFSHSQIQRGTDIDGTSPLSVSMPDNNTLATGGHDTTKVFRWNGSSWIQKGLNIVGETPSDFSGYSVSMSDSNTIAIGAPLNDDNGTDAGQVRIYSWNGSNWIQKGNDLNGLSGSNFGNSVSMPDQNTIAIGAEMGFNSSAGFVKVFKWNGNSWIQQGFDITGDLGSSFGTCVSMANENTLAIGAPYDISGNPINGYVKIYNWNGSGWIQKGSSIIGENLGDNFGYSISMSNENTLAIGGILNDGNGSNSGHVRVFFWNGNSWVQKGNDIDGESTNDYSGFSVSMPDENTIAIGAPFNNSVNGNDAGHVRIYSWNGTTWIQIYAEINGEFAFDKSGWSVSMPTISTIAIGARENNGGGTRVFDLCTNNTGIDNVSTCGSFTWIDGNTYTSNNNTATYTLTNSGGCDSLVTLNLVIQNAPDIQQICLVGIDSISNYNRIVWEKIITANIDSFYIYRESSVANQYELIGSQNYDSLSVWIDSTSNPAVQAYRYKLSVIDTCGFESFLGDLHKTIHLTINQGVGNTWNLIWSHYEGINFGSYNIYRGTDPTNISLLTTIQSNLNSYTDLTPPAGAVYYQIEVVNPNSCDPTKILGYDVSKSNIVNTQNVGTDLNSFNNIRVYPNPSTGVINIEVDPMLIGQTYELKDNMGRLVVQGFIYNPTEEINIKDLSTGVYLLSISNTSKVLKVIKN
jgi:hypothetical protein